MHKREQNELQIWRKQGVFYIGHALLSFEYHWLLQEAIQKCRRYEWNENWNRVVGQDDIVFHLGDFCLGGSHEWTKILNRLNGKIYLILGNHDLKNIRQGYASRFELTSMQMHIEVDKQKIYLNHCPFLCYGGAYGNTWQLFGHVHTSKYNTGKDASRLDNKYKRSRIR